MGKKRKGAPFDEYFSSDSFEIGRIGNLVSMTNHLTKEDVKKRNEVLSEQYEVKKEEIDNQITIVIEHIKKCNPLQLLLNATDRGMMNMLNVISEIQIEGQQNFELRAIEYIQSILACCKPEYNSMDNQEELIQIVLNEIDQLYINTQMFYIFWAARASVADNTLSESDIQYIMEAQLMGNVRGKRYQFQQLINIEKLLRPHSEKMQEIYNVSAGELLDGLKKLENSLSREKVDSIKDMFNVFQEFQKMSAGKSFDEISALLDQIRDSKRNIENSGKCFGTDLYNVKKVTGWSNELIDSLSWQLGECEEFLDDGEFSGWPVTDLPVQKRPFIKIDGVSYCFDYYNLFDNI